MPGVAAVVEDWHGHTLIAAFRVVPTPLSDLAAGVIAEIVSDVMNRLGALSPPTVTDFVVGHVAQGEFTGAQQTAVAPVRVHGPHRQRNNGDPQPPGQTGDLGKPEDPETDKQRSNKEQLKF